MDDLKRTGKTIQLAPTIGGYTQMARMFVANIEQITPRKHQTVVRQQLHAIVDVVRYLASSPEGSIEVRRLLAELSDR